MKLRTDFHIFTNSPLSVKLGQIIDKPVPRQISILFCFRRAWSGLRIHNLSNPLIGTSPSGLGSPIGRPSRASRGPQGQQEHLSLRSGISGSSTFATKKARAPARSPAASTETLAVYAFLSCGSALVEAASSSATSRCR